MDCYLKANYLHKLFPSREIVDLIFEEVFPNLHRHLQDSLCFSINNRCARVRLLNYKLAYESVEIFLTYGRPDLYKKIKLLSKKEDLDLTVKTLLKGFTICFIPETADCEVSSLFTDERSIFYLLDSVFD